MAKPSPTSNMQIDGGYIVLARQILESDIFFWKPPEWLKIWIYILLKVQYQNGRHFARGTEYFNWEEDKRNLKGITKHQWYHCIEFLRKERMVATQKTTRGNIIKVLKYDTYQNAALYKSETKSEARAKQKRSTSDTILKELKKGRKKEYKYSGDDMKLIKILKTHILSINPDHIFRGKDWNEKSAQQIRLMREQDKREIKDIKLVVDFAFKDSFWSGIIQSANSLRRNYDTMKGQIRTRGTGESPSQKRLRELKEEERENDRK